jgi:hypothetical protein
MGSGAAAKSDRPVSPGPPPPTHTVGVQYIRTAAILRALLGNIGRPAWSTARAAARVLLRGVSRAGRRARPGPPGLAHMSLDPNVHIQEVKVLACDIRPGRRSRGPALRQLVLAYRRRAGLTEQTGTEL